MALHALKSPWKSSFVYSISFSNKRILISKFRSLNLSCDYHEVSATLSEEKAIMSDFYVRYYVGHKGKFGHEFLEFEFRPDGKLEL